MIPLIHEVFGGLAPEAYAYLKELGRLRSQALGSEEPNATWAASSFVPFWRQRLSIAIHVGTALELARVFSQGGDHIRKLALKREHRRRELDAPRLSQSAAPKPPCDLRPFVRFCTLT